MGTDNDVDNSYEVSNIFTESKDIGWKIQGECLPNCQVNDTLSLSNINDVIGGYNPIKDEIVIIHRYSNDIWIFNTTTLEYKPAITNSASFFKGNLILSVYERPLFVTLNNTIYIWTQNEGIIGYNMNKHMYFDPKFNHSTAIYSVDGGKCMVTDGNCLILIYIDDKPTATLLYLNFCRNGLWVDITIENALNSIEFSCIFEHNRVYFIGGGQIKRRPNGYTFFKTEDKIKYIDTSIIQDSLSIANNLRITEMELSTFKGRFATTNVPTTDGLFIIGGYDGEGHKTNMMHLNLISSEITTNQYQLNLPHESSFAVLIDKNGEQTIFMFGSASDNLGAIEQCTVGMPIFDIFSLYNPHHIYY